LIAEAQKTPLAEMTKDPGRARAKRVTEAMPGTIELGISDLQKACGTR
jgi:hypothetical protein